MVKCSAIDCRISTGYGYALHRFPKDKKICAAWIHAMRCKNFVPLKHDRLCSNHFTSDCYIKLPSGYKALKRSAIPTIFYYPKESLLQENGKKFIQCFVPGCKTRCIEGEETGISEEGKCVHMFNAPSDYRLFEKWKYALSGSETHLSHQDFVCELHFQETDIQRQYIMDTSDTDAIKVDRCQTTLKCEAIPRLFSTELGHCINVSDNSSKSKTSLNCVNSNTVFNEENRTSSAEKSFTIQNVLQDMHLIKKPDDNWNILQINNFLLCVRFDENYANDRKVVIEDNLNVRVFWKEIEITLKDLVNITCIDDISSLLEKVNNYHTISSF